MKLFIALFILANCYQSNSLPAQLTIQRGGDLESYSVTGTECPYGVLTDDDEPPLSCACMTGVWAFYENQCEAPTIIVGGPEQTCISIDRKIKKIHLLSSPDGSQENVVVFIDEMKTAKARVEIGGEIPPGQLTILTSNAKSWGIMSSINNSCYELEKSDNPSGACRYDYTITDPAVLASGCETADSSRIITPAKCEPEIETTVCQFKAKQSGRVFSPMIKEIRAKNPVPEPEADKNGADKNGTDLNPDLASQIWNYLTSQAQDMLNISARARSSEPPSLTFKLLDLSKQIMQKTCPSHYVNHAHFDLALGTFVALQTKVFKFKDEFTDRVTADRIEDSLLECLYNLETYPFIDPLNRTAYANGSCDPPAKLGTYEAFGGRLELVINVNSSGRNNEPLIETVWKIFTHAHAACYKFFENSYSDHHHYTSIITPTFSNEINDIWNSVAEIDTDTYAGLLGDAVALMDGVSYCAEFAKLETEYPWELARPPKDLSNVRVKRDTEKSGIEFQCIKEAYDNTCPD